jgi:thiamine-phosphate pyrophosphorylase
VKLEGLYAVTPDWTDSERLMEACRQVVEAGATVLQLRRKAVPRPVVEAEAELLARLCARHGVVFIVNDDAELARAVGASGVHIGRDDGDILSARKVLGPQALIGVSCYAEPARAAAAEAAGADYVAVGSIFASPSKPHAVVAGLAAISALREATRLPLVAIGGIRRENLKAVRQAGADMAAIINDLFETGDPGANARAITRLWRAEDVCTE